MFQKVIGIFLIVLLSGSALKAADDKSIQTLNGFIFVVDVSGSMDEQTEDNGSYNNRYRVATRTINEAIETIKTKVTSDGLYSKAPIVTFSESASLVTVVDLNQPFLRLKEGTFQPDSGTNIIAGLDRAVRAAKEQSQKSGASVVWNVILITDGEHTSDGDPVSKLKQLRENTETIIHVSVVTLDFSTSNQQSYSRYAKLMNANGAVELISAVKQVIAEASVTSSKGNEGLYDACQLKVRQNPSLETSELQYSPVFDASKIVDRFVDARAIAYRATGPESDFSKAVILNCENQSGKDLGACLYTVCRQQVYGN